MQCLNARTMLRLVKNNKRDKANEQQLMPAQITSGRHIIITGRDIGDCSSYCEFYVIVFLLAKVDDGPACGNAEAAVTLRRHPTACMQCYIRILKGLF